MTSESSELESGSIIKVNNFLHSKNEIEESWLCVISYKQIYEWVKTEKLSYYIRKNGNSININDALNVIKKHNKQYIEEIVSEMLIEEYYSSISISINITSNKDKFNYNENDEILEIDTKIFQMSIIEGICSCCAVIDAININKDLNNSFYIKIMNLHGISLRNYMKQQDKYNIVSSDYFEKYNQNNKITKLITNINYHGNEKLNPLFNKIDFDFNTPNTLIPFELFKEGLKLSGFDEKVKNSKDLAELKKIEYHIVGFFRDFFAVVEESKINENRKKLIFYDATFIMRLLITCNISYKMNKIDKKAMQEVVYKLRRTKTKFTTDYPIDSRSNRLMNRKFIRLFGNVGCNDTKTISRLDKVSKSNLLNYKWSNTSKTERIISKKQRIGQDNLRKYILEIYEHKCALCDIDKDDLLKCSHIVHWSEDKQNRLNPMNVICFCDLHDGLFEKGYFSFNENYEIIYGIKADELIISMLMDKKFREP